MVWRDKDSGLERSPSGPFSEWDGFALRSRISNAELLTELEAEFFSNRNDLTGLGRRMLHQFSSSPENFTVLEEAGSTIYDPDLLLAFARAALYLFGQPEHAERLYLRALEVTRSELRTSWHYIHFLIGLGRRQEAIKKAEEIQAGKSSGEPWYGALLATTLDAVGEEVREELTLSEAVSLESVPPPYVSLVSDAVAGYCDRYLGGLDNEVAHVRLVDSHDPFAHIILGFARYVEMTEGVRTSLRYYQMACKGRERLPEVRVPYLRALHRNTLPGAR